MGELEAAAYLAGIFDGEGSVVNWKNRGREVNIVNTDLDIIDACKEAFEILGIEVILSAWPYGEGKIKYIFRISNQRNLKLFLDKIPFQSTVKRNKLNQMLATYRYGVYGRLEIPQGELDDLYHLMGYSVREIATHFNVHESTIYRRLRL